MRSDDPLPRRHGAAGDAQLSSQMRSWNRAGSVECEGSAVLREARFVWKQRGGVSCSRLGCFRLRCPLLASAIAVFNHNLPHLRVHPGSSLLLVRKSPEAGSCPGQLCGSALPPAPRHSRNGAGEPSGVCPGKRGLRRSLSSCAALAGQRKGLQMFLANRCERDPLAELKGE